MNRDSIDRFVDRYIEKVLDVYEQLEREEAVAAPEVHQSLLDELREGRRRVHHSEDWQPAAYALAAEIA
ncbi:MAG: hypothetical protein MI861_22505, partial [Pirellulales bacterium]|nr:hypothetical protein [Pirellulales bacterium]